MNEQTYWVEVCRADEPLRKTIRAAVYAVCDKGGVLEGLKVRIVSMPPKQAGATMVRGPGSEEVRILMNVVFDTTGKPVAGCLVNG